jgi:hypothetical protein
MLRGPYRAPSVASEQKLWGQALTFFSTHLTYYTPPADGLVQQEGKENHPDSAVALCLGGRQLIGGTESTTAWNLSRRPATEVSRHLRLGITTAPKSGDSARYLLLWRL